MSDVDKMLEEQQTQLEKASEILELEKQVGELTAKVNTLESDKAKLLEANQKLFAKMPTITTEQEVEEDEDLPTLDDVVEKIYQERKGE